LTEVAGVFYNDSINDLNSMLKLIHRRKNEGFEMNKGQIIGKLEGKGIQASYQRIKILEYLMKNRIHPTADDIYKALRNEIPTLSKTTVYNTLKTLLEKRIIFIVTTEEDELRYDCAGENHLHFKCRRCGALYDVFHKCEILKRREIQGHLIEESHIYLIGVCKKCRKESA